MLCVLTVEKGWECNAGVIADCAESTVMPEEQFKRIMLTCLPPSSPSWPMLQIVLKAGFKEEAPDIKVVVFHCRRSSRLRYIPFMVPQSPQFKTPTQYGRKRANNTN